MNLAANPVQKSKWFRSSAQMVRNRQIVAFFSRKSMPLAAKRRESNAVVRGKSKREIQGCKMQRDIFGATILPQNLSFENTKKLSENQIRLEDIPLMDENETAEIITAEQLKTSREKLPGKSQSRTEDDDDDDDASNVIFRNPEKRKDSRSSLKSESSTAQLFWVADPYDDIPGPKIFRTFLGLLKQLTRQVTIVSLFRFLKANAVVPFKVYGPIVKIPEILGGKIVLMSHPEHISAVFEQDSRFPGSSLLDSIGRARSQRRRKNSNSSRSLYLLPEEWDHVKKRVREPLYLKNAEKYFDGLDEAAEKFVRRIKTIRNGQNEVPYDFLFEINKWSLECLCFIIFEKSFGFLDYDSAACPSKNSQLLYSLTQATKKLCHLESGFQFWRFMNTLSLSKLSSACDTLESLISEFVGQVQMSLIKRMGELEEDCESVSVVESLLLQENATPAEVVSIILDNLLIGMNTMSTALAFLFYHLAGNPRVQVEVWKEVKQILPEKYCRLEYEHLNSFKYIQACLKESLRLKMPMPILSRILTQNITVSNYQLPKGTFVLMTAQVECMKEDDFDEPTEFFPERWLEQGISHPYASLPIGNYFDETLQRQLAELSVWMCASLVARHFMIDYAYGDIEATSTVISFPNKPLKFTFIDRKD